MSIYVDFTCIRYDYWNIILFVIKGRFIGFLGPQATFRLVNDDAELTDTFIGKFSIEAYERSLLLEGETVCTGLLRTEKRDDAFLGAHRDTRDSLAVPSKSHSLDIVIISDGQSIADQTPRSHIPQR